MTLVSGGGTDAAGVTIARVTGGCGSVGLATMATAGGGGVDRAIGDVAGAADAAVEKPGLAASVTVGWTAGRTPGAIAVGHAAGAEPRVATTGAAPGCAR